MSDSSVTESGPQAPEPELRPETLDVPPSAAAPVKKTGSAERMRRLRAHIRAKKQAPPPPPYQRPDVQSHKPPAGFAIVCFHCPCHSKPGSAVFLCCHCGAEIGNIRGIERKQGTTWPI